VSFLCDFYINFVEAEDTSSNDDKDTFGSTHPMFLIKNEMNLFDVPPGISGACKHKADLVKLELNTDGDKGMLHIS
jgi:hypothetical protein